MVKQKNVCVIGAGIAGLAAAKTFGARGHKVTILERSGDLFVGTHSIEQAGELPLRGLHADEIGSASLVHRDDRFPVGCILTGNQLGIDARRVFPREPGPGNIGKSRIQCLTQVHRALNFTCIDMPGFSRGEGLSRLPITSMLPLAGSTTGLTR